MSNQRNTGGTFADSAFFAALTIWRLVASAQSQPIKKIPIPKSAQRTTTNISPNSPTGSACGPLKWDQCFTYQDTKRRPKTSVRTRPPVVSANCAYPETRPATSEPEPRRARLAVRQPQAVWRLSGWRGPSAKEIFIGIHQRAHRERQVKQQNNLEQHRQRQAGLGYRLHRLEHVAEIRPAGTHQILHRRNRQRGHFYPDEDIRQEEGQKRQYQQAEGLEPNPRHDFSAQLHRRPEFQAFVGDERHCESPGHIKVKSGHNTEQGGDPTQEPTNQTGQQQLREGEIEPGEDVADRDGAPPNAVEEEQIQAAKEDAAQNQINHPADQGDKLADQRDQPDQKNCSEKRSGSGGQKFPRARQAASYLELGLLGEDLRAPIRGADRRQGRAGGRGRGGLDSQRLGKLRKRGEFLPFVTPFSQYGGAPVEASLGNPTPQLLGAHGPVGFLVASNDGVHKRRS